MTNVSASELAGLPFTRGLTAAHVERLTALASRATFPAGQRIFEEGEPATRLWLVRTGRVALDLHVPGQDRLIVETVGPGDELGLSWIGPAPRWQFGAVAQQEVTAFALDASAVLALCEDDHELGYRLTRRLLDTAVSRLQAARIRLLDLYASVP